MNELNNDEWMSSSDDWMDAGASVAAVAEAGVVVEAAVVEAGAVVEAVAGVAQLVLSPLVR